MYKILIVEDDLLLNKTLSYNLVADGYDVISAFNCVSALEWLKESQFDLVLLDINLPDGNGFDLCKIIKSNSPDTYNLFLTANDQEGDMIKGYDAGGFDYITKPFSITVLCKKVAVLFETIHKQSPKHDLYNDGILKIDFSEQTATLNGNLIELTPKEYRTLSLFIQNPKQILTKRQLLEQLWDIDGNFVDEHTLTTTISRIRKKIEHKGHKYIKTTYGLGYQWIGGDPQ